MSSLYEKFTGQDGTTMYRPTIDGASDMAHDRLAFCANCTEMHDDIGPKFAWALCLSCGQHKVFGHFHFDEIK